MPETLLQTKLFQPRQRPGLIARPLLLQKLTDGVKMGARLTLVSAPAGFGKTTLVASWLAGSALPSAWLSLDEREQALQRFLTYFVAALQTVFPADVANELPGAQTQALLALPEPPAPETLLTTLLNEIALLPEPIILVLDDYHLVDSRPVDEALAFLVDHLPPSLHIVLTSREDPNLPLPRLRVRGLLTEIRAADLRFDAAETARFLEQMTGLKLTAAELGALERRTEGWVAGLQLAALSLQGRLDAHQFINAFAGDNRYVVDYLLDEVLRQQPAGRRRFLLETAILSRLCADLCDAVSQGESDGQSMLEQLERSNLFVVPLDDRRHWYRYHQLFADVLQAHLMREQPEAVVSLHQRASGWYAAQGLMAEAIHHALAAGDHSRAADLMELAWREMDRQRQSAAWLRWVERLPAAVLANRPVLLTSYAWALLETGQLEAADAQLEAAERCLAGPDSRPIIVDEQEGACVAGTLAAARTYQALALGNLTGTMTHGRRALALLPADDHFRRATPGALLGLAAWAAGDLETAETSFAAAMSSYQQAGNLLFALTGTYFLAAMRLAQGRLRAAAAVLADSWQLAQTQGNIVLRGAADLLTGLAELQLEQNELATAQASLAHSRELGAGAGLPRWRFRWCRAQARLL
ncbi:MAG: AAA family ATPase, partial [Anaerolineales bacterium]|nr:AAA family ATPase [Anaerolineales bacterium]